ncbi:MAG: type VII secretion-associated serine protease mycosin [Pseudonocardiaceae bacterium]
MPRIRPVAVGAAAVLLCLAGPAWSATAQPDGVSPGVPPQVDPGQRPTAAEAGSFPYLADGQVGPATAVSSCASPTRGSGLDPRAIPAAQDRLRIREAQQFATGQGQTVAVIDSGVNPHPRLRGRLDDGGDYILGASGTSDCEGHGTVVAGIIAAAPEAGTGFVGVAPSARVLSIRHGSNYFQVEIPDPDSPGGIRKDIAGNTESMARAVVQAVLRGASVINISEAACFPAIRGAGGAIPDADLQAAVHHAAESDVVVVVAAANVNDESECRQNPPGGVTTISSPGWFDDDVLTVAATDTRNGEHAPFSIRGPWVDVAAPGTGIVSLDAAGPDLTNMLVAPNGETDTIQGTSFAAPYVAGVAALIRERYPELSARQVMERIERTAQAAGGIDGRNDELGHGVVNPVAALTDILPGGEGAGPPAVQPARLEDFRLPPPEDPIRRTIALAGAGAGVGLLGLTLAIVYTVRRYRRSKLAEAYRTR